MIFKKKGAFLENELTESTGKSKDLGDKNSDKNSKSLYSSGNIFDLSLT